MSAYPSNFQTLVELVGELGAQALCREYGGTGLYIPSTIKEDHPLAKLLGLGPARNFSAMYGGEEFPIPLGAPGACTKRAHIIKLFKSGGLTRRAIAREVGCTERWVSEVTAEIRNDTQADFF